MNSTLLDAIEINPPGKPDACIIWLHGLGANGHDFEPVIPQLEIVEQHAVRVVLPHAPSRAVTINNGAVMPAWYDIMLAADFGQAQDSVGICESEQRLRALIGREIENGIDSRRILLAGFSQGGAVVLHTGLRYPQPLAGILALSTYLPLADTLPQEAAETNRGIPVMMAHGTSDPVVPLALAEQSCAELEQQGYAVDWHTYPMQHAVCPEEINDIRSWIINVLKGK
jgi:phospholipase/carboxylesterase